MGLSELCMELNVRYSIVKKIFEEERMYWINKVILIISSMNYNINQTYNIRTSNI